MILDQNDDNHLIPYLVHLQSSVFLQLSLICKTFHAYKFVDVFI